MDGLGVAEAVHCLRESGVVAIAHTADCGFDAGFRPAPA